MCVICKFIWKSLNLSLEGTPICTVTDLRDFCSCRDFSSIQGEVCFMNNTKTPKSNIPSNILATIYFGSKLFQNKCWILLLYRESTRGWRRLIIITSRGYRTSQFTLYLQKITTHSFRNMMFTTLHTSPVNETYLHVNLKVLSFIE